jgi:hypothetical protein
MNNPLFTSHVPAGAAQRSGPRRAERRNRHHIHHHSTLTLQNHTKNNAMNTSTSLTQPPFLHDLTISAHATAGTCAMSGPPCPASIASVAISVTMADPDHRLARAFHIGDSLHPDRSLIQTQTEELCVRAGHCTGVTATTEIHLEIRDSRLFFGQLVDAGLMDPDAGHLPLTLGLGYQFFRHKVGALPFFNSVTSPLGSPASTLSPEAGSLAAEIRPDTDAHQVMAALTRFLKRDRPLAYSPASVELEVRGHAIRQLGLRLDHVLPSDLGRMAQTYQANCMGCPCHGTPSPTAKNHWTLQAIALSTFEDASRHRNLADQPL